MERDESTVEVDIVPGQLRATLRAGDLSVAESCPGCRDGRLDCAVYLSQGLGSAKQAEVAFILRRPAGTRLRDLSREPFQAMRSLYELTHGKDVHLKEGDLIGIGSPAFGLPSFGLGFLPILTDLSAIGVPPGTLLALVLHPDELEAAQSGGVHRVATWLGQHYRQYPYPMWYDPERSSVVPSGLPTTVLQPIPRLPVAAEARAVYSAGTLAVRLLPEACERLRGELADRAPTPFALMMGYDGEADCRVVWTPARDAIYMIGPPGTTSSRRGLGFVLVVSGRPTDTLGMVEDGAAIFLRDETWRELRAAICEGRPTQIALESGEQVHLEWIETSYFNPFDGRTYHVDRGWQKTRGTLPKDPGEEPGPVQSVEIRVLGPLPPGVSADQLLALFRATDTAVAQCLADSETEFELLVQHEVGGQGRSAHRLAARGPADQQPLDRLEKILVEVLAGPGRIETHGQTVLIHQRYQVGAHRAACR